MRSTLKRIAQNDPEFRGKVIMCLEIADPSIEDKVIDAMEDQGYEIPLVEESLHYIGGSSIIYWISSDEVDYFKLAYRTIKSKI